MRFNKKIQIIIFSVILIIVFTWGGVKINNKIEWEMAQNIIAAGGCPREIGWTQTQMIPCTVTTQSGNCTNTELCSMKPSGTCATYAQITGAPSVAVKGEMIPISEVLLASDINEEAKKYYAPSGWRGSCVN